MKKIFSIIAAFCFTALTAFGQTAYNPFTQNIHFEPEPTVSGFNCGSTPNVEFTMGLTTAADATQWQTDPLKVTICVAGFEYDGLTAASVVSGSYSTNFNWAFDSFSPNCIIGTQKQTLPGTGSNPLFPNTASTGDINLALKVPLTSPTSTVLSVAVTLQVPPYMATFNSMPDDNESTQTQTYCPCNALTSPGVIAADQTFCQSGNPVAFTNSTSPSGGSGGTIEYQWQSSTDNTTWSNISGATSDTYNAPTVSATTYYRRATKRSFCPNYIYSSSVKVTINNPLTSPGAIGSNQTFCDNGNPANLTNLTSGSGGNGGSINYQWQQSTDNTTWSNITGATNASYDPPSISSTTYYRRAAKRDVCGSNLFTSSVVMSIQPGVNAGANGSTTICNTNTAQISLASLITGEDAGGVWTRTSGTGGTFNASAATFIPNNGAATSTFNYIVNGVAPCPNDTSIATITIEEAVDAGTDGNTTVCDNNTTLINLASLITGEDAGGSWTRTSGTGGTFNASAGTFMPAAGATTSTFTYTVSATTPCPNDMSVATVNIQAGVYAGTDGNTAVCDNSTAIVDLTSIITGEDAGGTWTRTSGSGGIFNAGAGTFVPTIGATSSTFLYTVSGIAPCPNDVSVATINIQSGIEAGVDGNTTVCDFSTAIIDLTTLITGEDAGGTWTRISGTGGTFNAMAGTYTPAVGATTSTFEYVVTGVAPCPNDTSVAMVTINVCGIMISGNVYEDNDGPTNVDGSGIGSPSSMPLYANLVDPSGNVVGTTTIASNGTYSFNNVNTNTTYTMVLSTTQGTVGNPPPSVSLPTGWESVSEDCCDNTGNDGTTDGVTTIAVGINNVPNVNFGITQPLSLGNLVFNDVNQDGNLGAGEPVIAGAVVSLYEDNNNDGTPDGAAIHSTTTNAAGEYRFDDLLPGNYIVGVVPPAPAAGPAYESTTGPGQSSTPNDNVNGDDNGIATIAGETFSGTVVLAAGTEPTNDDSYSGVPDDNSNLSIDFGFYQPIKLTGTVYSDSNGPTDVGGTPIAAPNGTQLFANLVDAAGNVVGTDSVDMNGNYEFDDVRPNTTYTVVLSTAQGTVGNPAPAPNLPFGWDNVSEDCCDNTGNDGTTDGVVTVTMGTTDKDNANFGIHEPLAIGNHVWVDENQDGTLQSTEAKLQGATAKLYEDANADGIPDGPAIDTKVTDASGSYLFTGLDAGDYIVGVTPPTVTTGSPYESTDGSGEEINPNSDGNDNDNGISTTSGETFSGTISIAAGTEPTNDNSIASIPDNNANLSVDFGFFQPININGNVFNDQNGSSNIDGTPINNPSSTPLYVSLVDPSGNVIAVDTVEPNGEFNFEDVEPNTTYTITLADIPGTIGNPAPTPNLPTGWGNVGEDCCDNSGNDGTPDGLLTVSVGTSDLDEANFGIFEPLSIGNQVWIDSNKNGILDMGELPLSGAVVNLYEDVNNDGTPDGAAVATMTTTGDGLYKFEDLIAGNYIVGVTPPTSSTGDYTSSQTGDESNPNLDVDLNDNGVTLVGTESRSGTVVLMSGTEPTGEAPNNTAAITDANSNLTVDFGFFLCPNDFTFADAPLCNNTSIDLTSHEPVEYTGGVWSFNNQAVTNPTLVNTAGTYTYVYTNGSCTAQGDLDIFVNVPDYTPTIQIAPSAITGTSLVRVILTVSEILDFEACSDLYILVPKLLPRFQFNFQSSATIIGGIAVNNSDWQFFDSANPNFYVWKYIGTGGIYPGLGNSKIGYIGTYDPNNTDGQSTFNVQVYQGSGGETNPNNNTDSDLLIYFR